MGLILNIDTAVTNASICIAKDGISLGMAVNPNPKDQAAWIHDAIRQLLQSQNINLNNLEAVALSAGPGSYTGLRVGMATAKGICYGLNIPLITIGTLKMMASAAINAIKDDLTNMPMLLCPMIDARRMEVFAGVYDTELVEIAKPAAFILTQDSFSDKLAGQQVLFFGNGSIKFKTLTTNPHAVFMDISPDASHLAPLSHDNYLNGEFAGLVYTEPLYVKAFYTHENKKNM